ncbi:hypothetical protein BJY04DRAFT_178452 [Aspergillus karnatakaensis]|uniref:uncharacterized protein n=1 Tax=Aspergillus karnatakaensis TaxID=1810916 RepID=UPI003CCCFAB3
MSSPIDSPLPATMGPTGVIISPNADLSVEVNQYDPYRADGGLDIPVKTVVYRVERRKLMECDYFKVMFGSGFRESRKGPIILQRDNVTAMEIIFRMLHGTLSGIEPTSVSVQTVWHLVIACNKYLVDMKTGVLHDWFGEWYEAAWDQTQHEPIKEPGNSRLEFTEAALYPCVRLDHAVSFQKNTRYLVYHSVRSVKESIQVRDSKCKIDLYTDPLVIQQLNAARGRIRNILCVGLMDKVADLIKYASCECKEGTSFRFLHQLQQLEYGLSKSQ